MPLPMSTCRTSSCSSAMAIALRKLEDDALADVAALSLARGQLQHRAGPTPTGELPGPHLRGDGHDLHARVEEHDVDREAHKPRVHRRSRLEQQPLTCGQLVASKQSAHAHARLVGDHASLAYDAL